MVEETVTLVVDRKIQTEEAEVHEGVMAITPPPTHPPGRTEDVGRHSELAIWSKVRVERKIYWGGGVEINICEDMTSIDHSEYITLRAHNDQP